MNGTCPVTCNVNDNVTNPPLRLDTRECLNTSFGGNCNNSYLNRTVGCNVDVGCPGKISSHSEVFRMYFFVCLAIHDPCSLILHIAITNVNTKIHEIFYKQTFSLFPVF